MHSPKIIGGDKGLSSFRSTLTHTLCSTTPMARVKTRFVCQECGFDSPRWLGNCTACDSWNSFVEESATQEVRARVPSMAGRPAGKPVRLDEVNLGSEDRLVTGLSEFDRVMGGGIMQGSICLLAGDPGIGKSTLMSELARYLRGRRLLYVTGEESLRQVKSRIQRMGIDSPDLLLLAETNVEAIVAAAQEVEPDMMIVDSIQTLFRPDIQSAPGSVGQVRESAASILQLTKTMEFPTFLIGHVTKDGGIAGPRVLEHMVDTVVYFEGDRHHSYRILRAIKNRFGSTNEIGVFEMRASGLREVTNPSEIFLSERREGVSGSAVVCAIEGTRPILVEIQALVAPASYGTPQRTATGFDNRRMQMLLAVLEKRVGVRMANHDVFVNVAGGVRLDEPAVDLGVLMAVASSAEDEPVRPGTVFVGEVGLSGEIRSVPQLETRLKEAAKLGFKRAVVPQANLRGLDAISGLEVVGSESLSQAVRHMIGRSVSAS
jgi:DNA repair protein RadA/Sms